MKKIRHSLKNSSFAGESLVGEGYYLLHQYSQKSVIPLLVKRGITISIVELTTCGLVTDLLTGKGGATTYFILGVTPYTSQMKIKLGIPPELLTHDGPGTVSSQSAQALAHRVRQFSKSDIGIAETGMLPTDFQGRKTQKRAGEVFFAIDATIDNVTTKLKVDPSLSRLLMRQEIAWNILKTLESFLNTHEWPERKAL